MALTKTPIELSSTPGIVDNSNATAITIDSSENVLVGKTATAFGTAGIALRGTVADFTRDGGTPINVNRLTDDGSLIELHKNSAAVGSIGTTTSAGGTRFAIGAAGDPGIIFAGTGVFPATQISASDNTIDLGSANYRWKDIFLSGGVNFSANANAGGMSSETLDDYEEGTWTPGLNGSGYTFGTHTGTYVKVGRVCTVVGKLVVTGVGTNTSNMGSLTGFPFAALNTTNQFQTGVAREITTTGRLYIVQVNVNLTSGGINSMDGVASGSNEIFTTGEYCFSLTYITT